MKMSTTKPYMQESVKNISTDHNECIIDTEKLFSIFDKIIDVYDEPFADSSQIPTILLSEFARSKVKVALTVMVQMNFWRL